jgi:hypothetical protein
VVQRSWHPLFDEQQVTLHDLAAAVSAYQQQQQQQQGLVPNQQQPSSNAHGGGGVVGAAGLVARPTRMLARNKSCSSCEPLRPEQLLQHLQSLRWYQDQVRLVCIVYGNMCSHPLHCSWQSCCVGLFCSW